MGVSPVLLCHRSWLSFPALDTWSAFLSLPLVCQWNVEFHCMNLGAKGTRAKSKYCKADKITRAGSTACICLLNTHSRIIRRDLASPLA